MFQAWYEHPWHHPYAFWALQALCLGAMLFGPKRPRRGLFLVMLALIAIDGWCSASSGISPIVNKDIATLSALFFVVLGDARFFVLMAWRNPLEKKRLLGALGLSLIIPVASSIAMVTHPAQPRILFLTYELMFVVMALVMRLLVVPKLPSALQGYRARLCHFELVQYSLWATADIIILLGYDVGFLVRLVPNLMYYGAFVPYAYFSQEQRT